MVSNSYCLCLSDIKSKMVESDSLRKFTLKSLREH